LVLNDNRIFEPAISVYGKSSPAVDAAAYSEVRSAVNDVAHQRLITESVVIFMASANTYVTVQGDFFDSISYRIYKSERFAPALMRVNPNYSAVVKFDAGIVLNVPAVASSQNISNVPWGALIVT
jgi:phage tail protein X